MAQMRLGVAMPGARVASGDRLVLRTVEREGVPFLQRGNNPDVRRPMGSPVRNRTQIAQSVEETDDDQFVVCLDGDEAGPGQVDGDDVRRIGFVSVEDAGWKRPELAYWLVPAVRGEGYGSEAVSLAVDYAFRQYDAPAVGAGAFAFNDASRELLESLGFTEEGRRRKFMFVDGDYRDMVQYGLLREE
jgi:RimJ/RimL family protein N-acetyltransferase